MKILLVLEIPDEELDKLLAKEKPPLTRTEFALGIKAEMKGAIPADELCPGATARVTIMGLDPVTEDDVLLLVADQLQNEPTTNTKRSQGPRKG